MNFALAIFLKPFVMFVLAVCVLYPARLAVIRYMQEGKFKRFLLIPVGGQHVRWTPKLALFWTAFFLVYFGMFLLLVINP